MHVKGVQSSPKDISAYQNALISLIRSVNLFAVMSRTEDPLCNKASFSSGLSCLNIQSSFTA